MLPKLMSGDKIGLLSVGACGFVIVSNYHSRPLPAEILVYKSVAGVIRERQSFDGSDPGREYPVLVPRFSASNMLREQLDVRDGTILFHENFDHFDSSLTLEMVSNLFRDFVESLRS